MQALRYCVGMRENIGRADVLMFRVEVRGQTGRHVRYSHHKSYKAQRSIYMYRQFNIQQFYVLPTQCIYVFCVDLRTNSDYFTLQH